MLFPPEQGLRGRAELGRVPQLFQLPCGHAPCHPLLHLSSEGQSFWQSGAWQRDCEWGSPEHPGTVHNHTAEDGRLLAHWGGTNLCHPVRVSW